MENIDNSNFDHFWSTKYAYNTIDQILDKGALDLYNKYLWTRCPIYYAQDFI